MRKAGGIIAIIAGIFGLLAAVLTLVVGGVGSVLQADSAKVVVLMGWGGILFSILTIILGAVCATARTAMPAAFLIVATIGGMVLGGTVVAICMVLALVGGLLAVCAANSAPGAAPVSSRSPAMDTESGLMNADEIIARHLQRREEVASASQPERREEVASTPRPARAPSSPASAGFGKRGQLGTVGR
jgi:hypothetical protein